MKEVLLSEAIDRMTKSSNITVVAPIGDFGAVSQEYSCAALFPKTYCSNEMLCFSNRTYQDALTYIGSDHKNSIVFNGLQLDDVCKYSKLPFADVYDIHVSNNKGKDTDFSVWVR